MKITNILLLAFLLTSCTTTESKINKLVNLYNSITMDAQDSYMKSIKAQKTGPNEITIKIAMDVPSSGTTAQMYVSIFPELMDQMIFSIDLSKQLIREGVKIKCSLLGEDNLVIIEETYDKAYLMGTNHIEDGLLDANSDIDLYKMVELINKGLPVEDTLNDMTILKLEMLNDTEAQFVYLVPDEIIEVLMLDESIDNYMKDEYLRDPKQKKSLLDFFNLGLEKFYLTYKSKDETKIKKIEFVKADLK